MENNGINHTAYVKSSAFPPLSSYYWTRGSPNPLPAAAIPVANDFFVVNHCDTIATLGRKRQPSPMPTTRDWAKITCQYLVAMLVIIMPNTIRNVPVKTRARKYPAS